MKLGLAIACSLAIVVTPVLALTVEGNTITLTDEEIERCKEDGGCMVVSRGVVLRLMKQAQDEGFAKACGS